jgi:hypothetical protein
VLEPERHDRLVNLRPDAARLRRFFQPGQKQLGHSLRDCGTALRESQGPNVAPRRPGERQNIHAGVPEEAGVFGRDRRAHERRRKRRGIDPLAAPAALGACLVEHDAVAIEDDGRRPARLIQQPGGQRAKAQPRRHGGDEQEPGKQGREPRPSRQPSFPRQPAAPIVTA